MKKLIKNILLFGLICLPIYTILVCLFGNYIPESYKKNILYKRNKYGYTNTRLHDVKTYKNIDILFIGSSHSYRSYDTRIFAQYGFKTFNLGTSAQTPKQTQMLLKRYISKLKPKLVIFDANPVMFEIDGVESGLELVANDKNDIYSIKMAMQENNVMVYNTLIYSFYRNFMDKTFVNYEDWSSIGETYVTGGFVNKKISYSPNPQYANTKIFIDQSQFEACKENIEIVQKWNCNYIFVQTPISRNLYQSIQNRYWFDSVMTKIGSYYNFNKLLLNDTTDFYDSEHLNQNGVNIFDKKIIELINQKQLIHFKK